MKIEVFVILIIALLVVAGCAGTSKDSQANLQSGQDFTSEDLDDSEDSQQKEPEQKFKSTLKKVKGESSGKPPYAPLDSDKVVAKTFSKGGGVLEADLSKNVKMYVIVPEDNVLAAASAEVTIAPFKEMPAGEVHPALSEDYGYGAQVFMSSIQRGVHAYVVFDVSGGDAVKNIRSKNIYKNRCDPGKKWFNPLICARRNNVPADRVVDKTYTIITPIFSDNSNHNGLVIPRNTIPIGVEGLIVAEIDNGDVFVPQKLDQALVADIAKQIGKYGNAVENLEAAALAMEWNVPLTFSQLDNLVDSISSSVDSYSEMKKASILGKKLSAYANAQFVVKAVEGDAEDAVFLKSQLDESTDSTRQALFNDVNDEVSQPGFGVSGTEGSAAVGNMADGNVQGASEARTDVADSLKNNVDSSVDSKPSDAVDSGEALNDASPSDAKNSAQTLRDAVEGVISDPKSSVSQLLNALALAQALGFDDAVADRILDKIKEKLKKDLENAKGAGASDIAATAQALGFDDVADEALKKAGLTDDCTNLIKKNLANFGINECK